MELRYHPGDEFVPSFECDSLQVLAYVRFAGCDVTHVATCYPWNSPTGVFPVLLDSQNSFTDVDQIIQHLRVKGYDLDHHLAAEERADSLAFKVFCRETLLPAVLYLQWLDGKNYTEFTRQWYSRQLPFPLTLILPQMAFRRTENRLTTHLNCISAVEVDGNELLAKATHCLDVLSWQLGTKKYILGDRLTSLDAAVFAHLCIVLQQPLPGNNTLWKHLASHENLLRYCGLIRRDYFPELSEAPHPDAQVAEKPSLMRALTDPGTWAILGLGAAFLVLQFMRYHSMNSDYATRAPDGEEEDLDLQESYSEESAMLS